MTMTSPSKDTVRVEHTPTPWKHLGLTPHDQIVNGNLDIIAIIPHYMPRVEYEANARLIVRAVNVHDDLVKALEAATGILETLTDPKSQHVSSQHIWAQSVEAASKNRSLLSRLKSEG